MNPALHPLSLALLLPLSAAAQGPPPANVRTDAVREERLQERRLVHGDLRAARRARVASEEAGRVLELAVDEGGRVEAGALLLRLDPTRLELELAVLEAQEEGLRAIVTERRAGLEREERDLETLRDLVQRNVANERELADARTELEQVRARLAQGQNALVVLAARSALLRDRIEDTRVRAPFAGVVARIDAELGEWIAEGVAVAELVSDELEAWLQIPEQHLSALRTPRGPLGILTGRRATPWKATDWRLVPVVDPGARMLTLIASLPAHEALAPGMSATAWVPVADEALQRTVSVDALLRNEVGSFLYVAVPGAPGEPGSARPVRVEVLWQEKDRVVVSGPLEAGDAAIVEGKARLFPMAPVVAQDRTPVPPAAGEE